ncbi:MAG TPA: hypothetical protein VFX97_04860 [Pyrinomonadaceae bacterium]|nr:hypothetical protein [Pyrinomonadaceae bacterium]
MKQLSETIRIQPLTWIVSLVVLVALCFSIGEGLRLTPFPVSTITTGEASDGQFSVKASREVAPYKYGPVDVPPQNQKRNKRHTVDFVCAPCGVVRSLPTCRYGSGDRPAAPVLSALFVSRLSGRDPPSTV